MPLFIQNFYMNILLQLSAGVGPKECGEAVARAARKVIKDARQNNATVEIVEQIGANDDVRSIVLNVSGDDVEGFARSWEGTLLWVCALRSGAARKNWYFSGQVFVPSSTPLFDVNDIEFRTCRSSGAGGQHVNTTNSAVQAIYTPTGVSVRVEDQRSQHANKKMAIQLLELKHHEKMQDDARNGKSNQRMQHHTLERGNPKRVFHGMDFIEK